MRVKHERNNVMQGLTDAKMGLAQAEMAIFRQGEEIYEMQHALRLREAELQAKDREIDDLRQQWELERQALHTEIEDLISTMPPIKYEYTDRTALESTQRESETTEQQQQQQHEQKHKHTHQRGGGEEVINRHQAQEEDGEDESYSEDEYDPGYTLQQQATSAFEESFPGMETNEKLRQPKTASDVFDIDALDKFDSQEVVRMLRTGTEKKRIRKSRRKGLRHVQDIDMDADHHNTNEKGFDIRGTPADLSGPKKKFRILSIDGGGIRGIVPATILRRLAEMEPEFLKSFDLVTGTSTGGLISLMLATKHSPEAIERAYLEEADEIFRTDLRRRANPTKSRYTDDGKIQVISKLLGADTTMGDLDIWTLVTAFRIDGKVMSKRKTFFPSGRWRPSLFTNIPKAKGRVEPDLSFTCLDAAMATSAAPTYFPVYKGYIDGGLFAANPSLCAISKVCAHFPHIRPEDVAVLSLGCGGLNHKIDVKDGGDWGMAQWTPNLLSLFFDTSDLAISLHMTHMIGDRYHRLDPMLENHIEIDDILSIRTLRQMAEEMDLEDTLQFIREHFLLPKEEPKPRYEKEATPRAQATARPAPRKFSGPAYDA